MQNLYARPMWLAQRLLLNTGGQGSHLLLFQPPLLKSITVGPYAKRAVIILKPSPIVHLFLKFFSVCVDVTH